MAGSLPRGGKLTLGSYQVNMVDKIGQGSFGVVYRGKHLKKGFVIAAKQCDLKDDKAGSDAMIEIKHFQYLRNHPHIVRLHDFHYKEKAFWMLMEFCDLGDIEHYFKQRKPETKEQLDLMYQCASAIAYMHCQTKTVVHRDIKPGNILMTMFERKPIVKITDFGLSKIVDAPDPAKTLLFTTKAGTPGFMAPEFFLNLNYEKSVDVFALGLVFLAMMTFKAGDEFLAPTTGVVLIPVGAQMAQFAQMNMPVPEIVKDESSDTQTQKDLKKLIKRMIQYFPKDRCTMRQTLTALEDLGGKSPTKIPQIIPQGPALDNRTARVAKPKGSSASGGGSSITENNYLISDETRSEEQPAPSEERKPKVSDLETVEEREEKGDVDVKERMPVQETGWTGEEPAGEGNARLVDRVVEAPPEGVEATKNEDDDSDEEEGDVGYKVMKRAVEQAIKDRLDVSDEIVEGMRDMPFKELLAQCISPDRAVDEFEIGDQVVVLDDKERVRDLQDGYGGWNEAMAKYLGKLGVIKEKFKKRMLKVIHDDGITLHYNPKALYKTGEKPFDSAQLTALKALDVDDEHVRTIKARFKRFDVVKLAEEEKLVECLQEGHGGWNSKMAKACGIKGMVNRVDKDGDVFVEFIHGDDWTLNPELLIHVDMSGQEVEAGDFVIVVDDKKQAHSLQRIVGEWDNNFESKLGHSGVVRSVTTRAITVDMGRKSYRWHPSLIKLVAKGEEMMQAILKKNLVL